MNRRGNRPGDHVEGMPGFVYVNPLWPAGDEPCVERCADDEAACEVCGGSGEVYEHTSSRAARPASDIDGPFVCPRCCGRQINV